MDLGDPISYLALAPSTPVFAAGGEELGRVAEVVADEGADIFEGLAVDLDGVDGGLRFAAAEQVDAMYDRGVILSLDAAQAQQLPAPRER